MSTIEIELNSMNNTSDESSVITGDENEQKGIAGLDELLEQELKEDDSVDCFIKRVGDASEDSSEFGLNYDETPVVSSSAFYSPKEVTSTDNISSSLDEEFEDTLNKDKEVPLTSDTDKLQSGEEETTKDDMPVANTSVEVTDEGTKEIKGKWEDDMLNKNDIDSVQNQDENTMIIKETDSEVRHEVHKDDSVVENITLEKEMGDEVHDSTEVELPSEILNSDTEQIEKDTNSQSAKAENSTDLCKDVFYLVFQPKDQVSKINDGGKDNEGKKTVQCSDISTPSGSVIISNTSPDKPATQTVLTIAGSSEAKNGKAIKKSIIVKKITGKIIKNGTAVTTKPANECEVSDHTSGEGSLSSTMSSEPEEKLHSKSDNTNQGEPDKETNHAANVKTEMPKAILTRKVYANTKKSPKVVLQEKQVPNTEDGDALHMDTQDHHSNRDHDKNSVVDNGVKLPVETKGHIANKGKILPDKLEVCGKEGAEIAEKRTTNFGAIKRKFEEICRISREEEDAAIEEIKKMKKETLDVLKKINAEMEKLKLIFIAGK